MEKRPYSPRGMVIDRLAREKYHLRSPGDIHNFMVGRAKELGYDPKLVKTRSTISNYLYGDTDPEDVWMTLFAILLDLSTEEMGELAYANTFRELTAA